MENELMTKANLIALLTAIREAAKEHGENHTVELIDKILEETRK